MNGFSRLRLLCMTGLALLLATVAFAQPGNDTVPPGTADVLSNTGAFGGLGDLGGDDGELLLSGQLKVQQASRQGKLEITAQLTPGWHVYALDQQGGPGPAKLTVKSTDVFKLAGPFRPDHAPEVRRVEYFDEPLREHYGKVIWTAPVELVEGVDAETAEFTVVFDGQICHDEVGCKPVFGQAIKVTYGGVYEADPDPPSTSEADTSPAETADPAASTAADAPAATTYRAARSHAAIRGHAETGSVKPGEKFRLVIMAECEQDWHIYAYAAQDPDEIAKPTLIVLSEPAGWAIESVTSSGDPIVEQQIPGDPLVRYHKDSVTWTVDVQVPADVTQGEHELVGLIGYQTCTDIGCDPPTAAEFSVRITVGENITDRDQSLGFTSSRYGQAAALAAATVAATPLADGGPNAPAEQAETVALDTRRFQVAQGGEQETTLVWALVWAFLGGLILNIMPCVLPVIGLKVMAFVQQAGEDRGKVFMLNVWYAIGLISVFMVLATLAAIWNVGWGQHFSSGTFAITMSAVVFVMGLSFLGVWEIPIPGFVGTGKANDLAMKEGPSGAFLKGAITTLLATPCSGPGIGVALGYLNGKPPGVVYLIFFMLGLGMASPYLLIGANPKLMRFMPKPGNWMETFKQMMGFVLLGTVIYLLSFMSWSLTLPTLALLFGLWAACWWIGRIPITASFQVKLRGWVSATAFACLVAIYAYGGKSTIGGYDVYGLQGMMEHRFREDVEQQVAKVIAERGQRVNEEDPDTMVAEGSELRWQPFSEERLSELAAQNKTVLVDFTADWCLTCKTLEATVLNTDEVRQAIRDNGVVTLVADWTDGDAEISSMLEALGSKQVPVVAIFPAGRPNEPLVLMGFYTKSTLLDKLQQAGPSRDMAARPDSRGSDTINRGF